MSAFGNAILVGMGIFFGGIAVRMERTRRRATTDPVETTGTIQRTRLSRSGGSNPSYRPLVAYTYTYDGQTYTSNSVYAGWRPGFSRGHATALVDAYDPGQTVTVMVSREDPSLSYLQESSRRYQPKLLVFAGVGLTIVYAGLAQQFGLPL